jgi:large repetitive protein
LSGIEMTRLGGRACGGGQVIMNLGTFVARARWSGACLAVAVLALCLCVLPVQAQVVTTLPGSYPGAQFPALDAERTLYVSDQSGLTATPRVQGGGYGSPVTLGSGTFISTEGVALDGNGTLFVVDTGRSEIFKAEAPYTTFTPIIQIIASTALTGIAVDANDNVFFTDFHNAKVYELSASAYANGTTASSATVIYSGNPNQDGFVAVALDAAGNVYVTNDEAGTIVKLAAGTFTPSTIFNNNGFVSPTGIAIDGSGNIYFTDAETSSVNEIVAPAYTNIVTLADSSHFSDPVGVGLDAIGNIFVADRIQNAVKEIMAPPAVSAVSPNTGPLAGGTTVTITGTNLTGATAVSFGGTAATNVHVVSATQVTATSPANSVSGPVDVQVTTPNGTSPTLAADQFTYGTLPSVSSINPRNGPTAGGNTVTINGANFSSATSVQFGSNAAAFSIVSDMQITATAPPGSAGPVNVTVTNVGGPSITSGSYTYVAAPTVSAVSPGSGPGGGGTPVTITGSHFTGATAVSFGVNAATNVTVGSDSQITATAPTGSGTVDVTVTTPGGTSATSEADAFTYVGVPTVTAIAPSTGPTVGGTFVTITGTNFSNATSVQFGTMASVDFSIKSATQIVAAVPLAPSVETVDITVTSPGGTSPTSSADLFTYYVQPPFAPVVTSVSPAQGPPAGGTTVTITGAGFTNAMTVRFGTVGASFALNGDTQITATSPAASAPGAVDVTVTTAGGTSVTSAADKFTYGVTRTWVSGVGNDSNACDRTSPCLTFAAALANTTPGGEIDVLNAGDFGPLTITKSITIDNETSPIGGASVSTGSAITIQAGANDVINLHGLTLAGAGAVDGILITSAARVDIENCSIQGFGSAGIAVSPASGAVEVKLANVTSAFNTSGIVIQPASGATAKVTIARSHVDNNLGAGLQADGSGGGVVNAAVADSSLSANATNGALALGGAVLNLTHDAIAGNGSGGVASSGGATVTVGGSQIVNNATGVSASGGTLISYGNNQLVGNGSAGRFTSTGPLN